MLEYQPLLDGEGNMPVRGRRRKARVEGGEEDFFVLWAAALAGMLCACRTGYRNAPMRASICAFIASLADMVAH